MHYNLLNNNFWTITARMSTLIYANCVSAWCQFNYSCLVFSKLLVFILVEEFVAGFLGSKQLIKLNGYSKKMHHFVIRVLQLCSLRVGKRWKNCKQIAIKTAIIWWKISWTLFSKVVLDFSLLALMRAITSENVVCFGVHCAPAPAPHDVYIRMCMNVSRSGAL